MRRILLGCWCLSTACGPVGTADLSLSVDRAVFDGRTQRAIVQLEATDESGASGTGVVQLTAGVGAFVEGDTVALVAGKGSVTYRCNPTDDAACAGPVRLGATWKGISRSVGVRVTPSDPTVRPLWRVVPTLQAVTLYAAALGPQQTVYAVGERGVVVPFTISAGWGAPLRSGVTSTLRAIAVDAQGQLTIAGDDGVLLQGPPTNLQAVRHTAAGTSFSALLLHDGTFSVGTPNGTVGRWDVNDLVFSDVSRGPINALESLAGSVVALGDDGMFRTTDGVTWSSLAPPVLARWISARADTDGLWALGKRLSLTGEPLLVLGPGPDWKSAALPAGEVQAMTWGLGTADRYVATDVSVFRQQAGSTWEDLEAPSGGRAIVLLGGTSVLVVGPPGVSLLRVR